MKSQADQGFTLIEITVVLLLIGILSAIALPGFLNQAAKGKHAEARLYLGTANRLQQAYYTEHTHFAASFTDMGLAVPDSLFYVYTMTGAPTFADIQAAPKSPELRGFRGCAWTVTLPSGQVETRTDLLEGEKGEAAAACPAL